MVFLFCQMKATQKVGVHQPGPAWPSLAVCRRVQVETLRVPSVQLKGRPLRVGRPRSQPGDQTEGALWGEQQEVAAGLFGGAFGGPAATPSGRPPQPAAARTWRFQRRPRACEISHAHFVPQRKDSNLCRLFPAIRREKHSSILTPCPALNQIPCALTLLVPVSKWTGP